MKNLSHGLRKRADIAGALIHDPHILLFDELFAGLDIETRGLLIDYFENQREKTLLISSHVVEWAKSFAIEESFSKRED